MFVSDNTNGKIKGIKFCINNIMRLVKTLNYHISIIRVTQAFERPHFFKN